MYGPSKMCWIGWPGHPPTRNWPRWWYITFHKNQKPSLTHTTHAGLQKSWKKSPSVPIYPRKSVAKYTISWICWLLHALHEKSNPNTRSRTLDAYTTKCDVPNKNTPSTATHRSTAHTSEWCLLMSWARQTSLNPTEQPKWSVSHRLPSHKKPTQRKAFHEMNSITRLTRNA